LRKRTVAYYRNLKSEASPWLPSPQNLHMGVQREVSGWAENARLFPSQSLRERKRKSRRKEEASLSPTPLSLHKRFFVFLQFPTRNRNENIERDWDHKPDPQARFTGVPPYLVERRLGGREALVGSQHDTASTQ
jgi:hypothetical protein